MINSRDLDDLEPKVRRLAILFREACAEAGIDVLFTSTRRDAEAQASLYAIGRTVKGANPRLLKPMGDPVTNAKPGTSYHEWGVAFDFVPMIYGKPAWNDTALFARCGEIAESVGLEWSGRWKGKFQEMAHCQYTAGLSLADFKVGKTIEEIA